MSSRQLNPVLSVRLGGNTKAQWQAYCHSRGTTTSAAVQALIDQALSPVRQASTDKFKSQVHESPDGQPKVRFEVLLTQSEKKALLERAQSEACSQRRWVIDAIRVGLTNEPQFNSQEIETLGESNYQLLAIGRNLNQITRAINERRVDGLHAVLISELKQVIDTHTDKVNKAIRSSLERWDIA